MKHLQLPFLALALGLVLSANTCSGPGNGTADAMSEFSHGKWSLATLHGKEAQLQADMQAPYIALDSASGRLIGFGGCNRMAGEVKIHGDSISFPGLVSTRMYCEGCQELENGFMAALRSASTFTLRGDRLILLGAGQELAVLVHGE